MLKVKRKSERGQVLVIAALLLPVLLAMTGMAIDAGRYASDRRSLQNAADAIALAAVQDLCDDNDCTNYDDAIAAGNAILGEYDIAAGDVLIEPDAGSTSEAPHVHVTIERPHDFVFMQIVGIASRDVGSRATAMKVSFGGGEGIVPWGVEEEMVTSVPFGTEIVLKYDANNPQNGNFGPIRIDIEQGQGSSDYESSVSYGSDSYICSEFTAGCDEITCTNQEAFPSACAENAAGCDGAECKSKTGNMVGATEDATDFRLNNTSTACDEFEEVFTPISGTDKHRLENACNPWIDGPGACPNDNDGTLCSRRVMIVPIIDEFGNGSEDVTVTGFALVFLEGYAPGACTGNDCEIAARFVKADVNTGGLSGRFDPGDSIQFVRLSE